MWDVEAQIITRTGVEKWTHAIARPHRQADGSVLWDGVILDATWMKTAKTELRKAKEAGFVASYVSNGNSTDEVIDFIRPWLDFYKIDLKGFDDKRYRSLGGTLQNVLDGVERVYKAGLWLEVVTLIVPGFNDSDAELGAIAGFLAELSPDIPWHVTAFHPDYRMQDKGWTPTEVLLRAHRLGKAAGLNFVYPGNVMGQVGDLENTCCPHCGTLLVER